MSLTFLDAYKTRESLLMISMSNDFCVEIDPRQFLDPYSVLNMTLKSDADSTLSIIVVKNLSSAEVKLFTRRFHCGGAILFDPVVSWRSVFGENECAFLVAYPIQLFLQADSGLFELTRRRESEYKIYVGCVFFSP